MSQIPKSRQDLVNQLEKAFELLMREVDALSPQDRRLRCVDDWTVKDLIAVRVWWTERVVDWIEWGFEGRTFELPAKGFKWNETPKLNADIVKRARRDSFKSIHDRLGSGYVRVLATIEILSDTELLETGMFDWAGNHPLARWISINTSRQYATARTMIRRARRERSARD